MRVVCICGRKSQPLRRDGLALLARDRKRHAKEEMRWRELKRESEARAIL